MPARRRPHRLSQAIGKSQALKRTHYSDWKSYKDIWHKAIERRRSLFETNPTASVRLIHTEENSPLRLDKYGSVAWWSWYGNGLATTDKHFQDYLRQTSQDLQCHAAFLRPMLNRGQDSKEALPISLFEAPPMRWTARDNDDLFELRADCGLSPGLFIDQSHNRSWVKEKSPDHRILNLFSYTCSFSVASAMAGASEVCSVDTSQRYLEWGRENFKLNGLNPENYTFFCGDAREFVLGAHRRERQFDLIICDPPSFARSKGGLFRIQEEAPWFIENLAPLLSEKGLLLFSSNYEGQWKTHFFGLTTTRLEKLGLRVLSSPSPRDDLQVIGQRSTLKSLIFTKSISSQ